MYMMMVMMMLTHYVAAAAAAAADEKKKEEEDNRGGDLVGLRVSLRWLWLGRRFTGPMGDGRPVAATRVAKWSLRDTHTVTYTCVSTFTRLRWGDIRFYSHTRTYCTGPRISFTPR